MLVHTHIKQRTTEHTGFSDPPTSLGATGQEGGGEGEINPESNDPTYPEPDNGEHEPQLNRNQKRKNNTN